MCGCSFATRQGLSSHARLHLRHLGVPLSECTDGPIALLYELKESKGSQLDFTLDPKVSPDPEAQSRSKKIFKEVPVPEDPLPGPLTGLTGDVAALPLVSPHKTSESRESEAQSSSSKQTTLKPLWAPQDTDAPLTLGRTSELRLICVAVDIRGGYRDTHYYYYHFFFFFFFFCILYSLFYQQNKIRRRFVLD